MSDLIDRQAAIDTLLGITAMRNTIPLDSAIFNIKKLPSIQPERKDAIEKDVAVEAISDELMSRFDISATYAYEVAETAVNRIEMMAKEMGDR